MWYSLISEANSKGFTLPLTGSLLDPLRFRQPLGHGTPMNLLCLNVAVAK